MTGFGVLGTLLLGTGYIYGVEGTPTHIMYNEYDFPNVNRIVNRYNRANVQYSTYGYIRNVGLGFDQSISKSKTYTIEGMLKASTYAGLEEQIDSMIQALQKPNQQLKIKRRDEVITYCLATPIDVSIPEEHYNITFIPYSVTISNTEPFVFGSLITEQERLGTTSNITSIINYTGGNENGSPYILLDCKTGTSVTGVSVTIGTNTVTIPVTLANTDTLLINKRSGTIWKNGSPLISWTGPIPRLEIGANSFDVTFEGTPNIDVYLMYYPSYA